MFIDVVCLVLLAWAILKGFRNGLVVAIFSFLAIIIGLAAALKLSALVASHLGAHTNISERWLPLLAFTVVFIGVMFLVRLGASAIEKVLHLAMLGWVNRLGGILFYALLHLLIFSVLLFFAEQINIFKPPTFEASVTYPFIRPLGPKAINALGAVIPWFGNMFHELESFFEGVSQT